MCAHKCVASVCVCVCVCVCVNENVVLNSIVPRKISTNIS